MFRIKDLRLREVPLHGFCTRPPSSLAKPWPSRGIANKIKKGKAMTDWPGPRITQDDIGRWTVLSTSYFRGTDVRAHQLLI